MNATSMVFYSRSILLMAYYMPVAFYVPKCIINIGGWAAQRGEYKLRPLHYMSKYLKLRTVLSWIQLLLAQESQLNVPLSKFTFSNVALVI